MPLSLTTQWNQLLRRVNQAYSVFGQIHWSSSELPKFGLLLLTEERGWQMKNVFYIQAIRLSGPIVVEWVKVVSEEVGPVKRQARVLANTATDPSWTVRPSCIKDEIFSLNETTGVQPISQKGHLIHA